MTDGYPMYFWCIVKPDRSAVLGQDRNTYEAKWHAIVDGSWPLEYCSLYSSELDASIAASEVGGIAFPVVFRQPFWGIWMEP